MGTIVPAPENARKKIWGVWSIAPVKKIFFLKMGGNNLSHFIHFQLQNNAPYALKLHLK
jgi:hypothetical protein